MMLWWEQMMTKPEINIFVKQNLNLCLNQKPEQSFVDPPDGVRHLGEVMISYTQAVKQAQEQGHNVAQELALLIVHGVLHLLGYDHELPQENQLMRAKENEILGILDSK